ncbi:MAG: CGNR zinc finger domain-containing protein [Acidimicrobiales bacterium]
MRGVASPRDEQALLDLLNSTPVVDRHPSDLLAADAAAIKWARSHGGQGTKAEATRLREVRDRLQAVVGGGQPAATLKTVLGDVYLTADIAEDVVRWTLRTASENHLAARMVLAWSRLQEEMPGRLRPCANDDCRLFLLDRSRANTARWCSMNVCGNRLKARRHYERATIPRGRKATRG